MLISQLLVDGVMFASCKRLETNLGREAKSVLYSLGFVLFFGPGRACLGACMSHLVAVRGLAGFILGSFSGHLEG